MTLPFYIVDVFAEKKYAGNQLAVFFEADQLTEIEMQQIAREINFAESTFVTQIDGKTNGATIRIFTPEYEMQFAGHPIIGTSWVLMNKIFDHHPQEISVSVPVGAIPVRQSKELVWLESAQPRFYDILSKEDFSSFSNLKPTDFDTRFEVQEVTTGSAFVIVPLKNKETLNNIQLDVEKTSAWLNKKSNKDLKGFYFFCLEQDLLTSRLLFIENNHIMEDAATGSASTCLQAFLLKYYQEKIEIVNHQGEYMNRNSQIYFEGNREEASYDINIGGKTQFIAQGEWNID